MTTDEQAKRHATSHKQHSCPLQSLFLDGARVNYVCVRVGPQPRPLQPDSLKVQYRALVQHTPPVSTVSTRVPCIGLDRPGWPIDVEGLAPQQALRLVQAPQSGDPPLLSPTGQWVVQPFIKGNAMLRTQLCFVRTTCFTDEFNSLNHKNDKTLPQLWHTLWRSCRSPYASPTP